MSLFNTIKLDGQKELESLMGDIFNYQKEKILNSPTLVRLRGEEPKGNLTQAQIDQGARGATAPIATGNSNGSLQNSVESPWVKYKMLFIGMGVLLLIVIILVYKK